MKKLIYTAFFLIFLIFGNYILRYMHIQKLEDKINYLSEKISEQGIKFSYKNIDYTNIFFWNIDGKIISPKFAQDKFGYKEDTFFEFITFHSKYKEKSLYIQSSDKMTTNIDDSNGKHTYIYQFEKQPEIYIKFKNLSDDNYKGVKKIQDYFAHNIEQLLYESSKYQSFKLLENNEKQILYTADKSQIKIKNLNTVNSDGVEIQLNINNLKYTNNNSEKYYDLLSEMGSNSYKINANLYYNFKTPALEIQDKYISDKETEFKLDIKELLLTTDIYKILLSGDFIFTKSQFMPFYILNLKVENFHELLNFYSKFYNEVILKAKLMEMMGLNQFTEKQQKAIEIIYEDLLKKSFDENNKSIKLERLSKESFLFNNESFHNLLEQYGKLVDAKTVSVKE
ncbi:MAG: hypothetical protein ACI8ZF_000620 [Candidatus Midichloriaceae bacterium]|jgi:hypothetical protein